MHEFLRFNIYEGDLYDAVSEIIRENQRPADPDVNQRALYAVEIRVSRTASLNDYQISSRSSGGRYMGVPSTTDG